MNREVEMNKCDICGKITQVNRKYYYYDIECDCHSPKHFEIVYHYKNCTPSPPFQTKITFLNARLKPTEE